MIKVYYRFSFNLMPDNTGKSRTPPQRPDWFNKWKNLNNFVNVFQDHEKIIIADGVDDNTYNKLNILYPFLKVERTNYGSNAGSFLHALSQAITLPDNTNVYFVEDDYLHHEGADIILEQGLEQSPYVSLYDHPDKYWGDNSSKLSNILITEDCHWRTVESTTMTFASKVKFLKEDFDIFYKWCGGKDKWTHDTQLFTELSNKRSLITPIPGYATHLDSWVIGKLVNWEDVMIRTSTID